MFIWAARSLISKMASKLQAELRILTIHGVTWVMQYGL